MKKIFTLMAATLITAAVFAADHRPVVTLKASRNYEVVIDGQSYFSSNGMMNISNIRKGQHSIKVYELNRGFMSRRGKRLVDASTFRVKKNDVDISVNFRGQISITEDRFGRDNRNDRRDDGYGYDGSDNRDHDSHDRDQRNDKNDRDKKRF